MQAIVIGLLIGLLIVFVIILMRDGDRHRMIDRLRRERNFWEHEAARNARNTSYYRSLVIQIGHTLDTPAVFTADDGGVHDDVLCDKVPEVVARLVHKPLKPRNHENH